MYDRRALSRAKYGAQYKFLQSRHAHVVSDLRVAGRSAHSNRRRTRERANGDVRAPSGRHLGESLDVGTSEREHRDTKGRPNERQRQDVDQHVLGNVYATMIKAGLALLFATALSCS